MTDQLGAGTRPFSLQGLWRTLGLNAALPYLGLRVLTAEHVPTVTALCVVAVFPVTGLVLGWARTRRLNAIGAISLLVIVLGIAAALITGDPRVILAKESVISGGWSVACWVSLTGVGGLRPIMFYLARQLGTGGDPVRMARYDEQWRYPGFRRAMRVITAVWAVIYLTEALLRVILAFTLPAATVLAVSSLLLTGVTGLTAAWTMRYSRRMRQRVAQARTAQESRRREADRDPSQAAQGGTR